MRRREGPLKTFLLLYKFEVEIMLSFASEMPEAEWATRQELG